MTSRVIHVQRVPKQGYFSSVADAVEAATPNSTISIGAGTYIETQLPIDKPGMKFIAEGDGMPVIQAHGVGLMISSSVSFTGIQFVSDDPVSPAVVVVGGCPTLTKCSIQSLFVDVDGAPIVQHCTFSGSPTCGLTISGSGAGEYRNNTFKMNRLYSVMIDTNGSPLLQANQFAQSGHGTICVHGSRSTPLLKMNNIQDSSTPSSMRSAMEEVDVLKASLSERAGVIIANGAAPTLESNTIFAGDLHGVAVFGKSWLPARLQSKESPVAEVTRKGRAIHTDTGVVNMVRNTLRDNKGVAVFAQQSGVRVVMESNSIEENLGGIAVHAGAVVNMKNDTLRANQQFGARCEGNHSGLIMQQCTIMESKSGVAVSDSGLTKLANCAVERTENATYSCSRATLELEKCTINNNDNAMLVEEFGVISANNCSLQSNSVGTFSRNNGIPQITKCTYRRNTTGVHSITGSRGTISECSITESVTAQVLVSDRGNTRFIKNEIRDAECSAIIVRHHGLGEFVENTCTAHKATTVKVEFGADPSFFDNILSNGTSEGVLIDRGSTGTFVGNKICDFKASSGVVVRSGCEPTFRCNTIEGNSLAGIDVQQGAKGIYEKNFVTSNTKTAVNLTGSGNVFATVAKNRLRDSPVGVLACDSARSLVISNDISRCQIGVAGTTRSVMNCVSNVIYENRIGVLVTDPGTKGYFVANNIHRNFDGGVVVRNEAAPLISKNTISFHFEEDDDASVRSATNTTSGKIRASAAVPGILLKEGCGGKLMNNTIVNNSVGVEAHRTKAQFYSNIFAKNRCGLWCKNSEETSDIRSTRNSAEYTQYVSQTNTESAVFEASSEDDTSTTAENTPFITALRARHCTFLENGIGVSCSSSARALLEFCYFTKNSLAGLSVTGRSVDVLIKLSVFVANDNHSVYAAGKSSSSSAAKLDSCFFNGKESPFLCTKGRDDITVSNSVFACCPVDVSLDAHPQFVNTSHTGFVQSFAASVACAEDQFVEFVNEAETRQRSLSISVSGSMALKQNRVMINVWSFPLDQCIRVYAKGRGRFEKTTISFADEGAHLEKTDAVFDDCAFYRCKTSGLNIAPGFGGTVNGCAFFSNYGCGIRIVGKMLPPAMISNAMVFGNCVMNLTRGATTPSSEVRFKNEDEGALFLPDVSDDTPYCGQERDTKIKVEAPVPRYSCPSSDGPGIGIFVEASGCIILSDSEVLASGLANLVVTSKIKSTITRTKFYSSDGYGVVVRQAALMDTSQCYFMNNAYSGALCETNAAPCFDGCTFSGNAVGAVLFGDKTMISKSRFIDNNVCGIRVIDGSQSKVTDCEITKCGCGIECRAPVSTAPLFANCDIHTNLYAGILCSGYSRPTIRECNIHDHDEVAGVVVRCSALAKLEKCRVDANKVGILCRLHGEVMCEHGTISDNRVGVTVEFSGIGTVKRCISKSNVNHSVLCRTQGNMTFAENMYLSDAPVLVTMEGLSTFKNNTFRSPASSCFLIQRGGNPSISHTRFQALHTPTSEIALLRLQQQTSSRAKGDSTTSASPDEQRRRMSSLRRKTVDVRPSSSEMQKRRKKSYVALARRRGTISETADESSVKTVDPVLMLEASQIVEEEYAAIDKVIPIKVEVGGMGTIEFCFFAHNRPCSILVDGATSEPVIENNVFFDHVQSALVLSSSCTPRVVNNLFYRNHLGVQLSLTTCPISACYFLLNETGIESGGGCGGGVQECTFVDDNLGVNCLEGTTTTVENCTFHRCDTCCYFDNGSNAKFVKNRCFNSSKSGVTSESDSASQLVDDCTFIGGGSGVVVGPNGLLKINETEVVNCSGPGIAFHSDSSRTTRDAAQGSAAQCTILGCGAGVSVSGHGTTPSIQDCTIQFCTSGVEVRNHANPTVQLTKFLQNTIGLFAHSNAMGTFRRIQIVANDIGVKLVSGSVESPLVSHCNILDSAQVGVVLDSEAAGEIADCLIFDNEVGVQCSGRATTKIDFTSISHAMSEARAKDKALKVDSEQQKVELGSNVKIKYDHSPPYNQLNARLRGVEQTKAKNLFKVRSDTLVEEAHHNEDACRDTIGKILHTFGHSVDRMVTVLELPQNELDIFIGVTNSTTTLAVSVPEVLRDLASTIPKLASPEVPESAEEVSTADVDDKPFTDYEPAAAVSPKKRKKKAKSKDEKGKVHLPKVREVKRKARAVRPPSKPPPFRRSLRSRLSTDSRPDDGGGYGSLNGTQLLSLTGRRQSQAELQASIEDFRTASVHNVSGYMDGTPANDDLDSTSTLPLLPQLPTLSQSTTTPYPRKRVEVPTQTTTDAESLLPPLMPRVPSTLALTCLNHPQHAKFRYSTAMHGSVVELGKDYNSPFADQVLQAFRAADRRQREGITVPDLARFVERLCETYRFHPGKVEAARRATLVQMSTRTSSAGSFGDTVNSQVFVRSARNSVAGEGTSSKRQFSIAQPVSPFTPLPQFSLEFARNVFLELFQKDPETDQLDINEFCTLVIYNDSIIAPLFQLHFTWMLKQQPVMSGSSELYVENQANRSWRKPKGAAF